MKVINNSKKKQSTNSTKAFDGVIFTTDMVTHDAQNDPSHNLPLANLDCVFFCFRESTLAIRTKGNMF